MSGPSFRPAEVVELSPFTVNTSQDSGYLAENTLGEFNVSVLLRALGYSTEELLNYFRYAYPAPRGKQPFSITAEVGPSPWHEGMKIVRVEAIPLSIPCRYGAEGWSLGAGGWKALDFCLVRVQTDSLGRLQQLVARFPAERAELARTHFTRLTIEACNRLGGPFISCNMPSMR